MLAVEVHHLERGVRAFAVGSIDGVPLATVRALEFVAFGEGTVHAHKRTSGGDREVAAPVSWECSTFRAQTGVLRGESSAHRVGISDGRSIVRRLS